MLRLITNQKLRPIFNREYRPHLLVEDIQFELPNEEVSKDLIEKIVYFLALNIISCLMYFYKTVKI